MGNRVICIGGRDGDCTPRIARPFQRPNGRLVVNWVIGADQRPGGRGAVADNKAWISLCGSHSVSHLVCYLVSEISFATDQQWPGIFRGERHRPVSIQSALALARIASASNLHGERKEDGVVLP